ncbi:ATP-binding domain-containing protein [Streptomyces sp. CS7]|uniref:ATP-binding domain-containing protein n=1 Tax=Streptomyces sp. CS-7 TaxID=2906769 RepID=UPI0021B21EE5|nr:ATP-binding domain-containing protein [Streptomyces sp. CS-7]MCT6775905.1 ATP-binding domain-containing protein [Streptomyces sp. CS-7]
MKIPGLLALESDQFAVVDLPFDETHLISGSQGSGKTVAAVYRAWIQATAGNSTSLITHSKILTQYIEHFAGDLAQDFRVMTFHRWLREFWNIHFQEEPPVDGEDRWTYDWTKMQLDCFHRMPNSAECLVIDEGQNLPPQFYELCNIIKIPVTVFIDPTASVGDGQTHPADIDKKIRPRTTSSLQKNHRNSREIAMLAELFSVGAKSELPEYPERSGDTPHLMHCSSGHPFIPQLSQYISSHPECTIGIICRTTELQREIHLQLSRSGLHSSIQSYISDDMNRTVVDFSTNRIFVINVASMKGLEFDIVFVPDMDSYTEDPTSASARERLQTLCMRARNELHFVHHGHREPEILADVPASLLGRRTV